MSKSRNFKPLRFRHKTRGRSRKEPPKAVISGKIRLTASGFGFVVVEGRKDDIFIPPRYVGDAMDGDTVRVEFLPERRRYSDSDRGPAGKVVNIEKRGRDKIVGELLSNNRVRPLDKRLTEDIKVSGKLHGCKRGDWVEVKLIHDKPASGARRGIFEERIGRAGEIIGDLDAICREYELPERYSAEQEEKADKLKPRQIKREDLTDRFCVTIDPADAKDYDDAVSVEFTKNPGEVELGVHIADVAAWIKPGSGFDKEALRRGFTAYLPGRTLPMLPKGLTRNISLSPEVVSLAHSALFTVNIESGRIMNYRRCHSKIKVTRRLTFGQVQDFIDKDKVLPDWDEGFIEHIQLLVKLFKNMRKRRREQEKFLEMAIPEIRVMVDEEKNEILGMAHKEQREADQLVEEFMLAANSAVAAELSEKSIPGLFRVHPEPEPEKLEEFSALMASSFKMSTGDLSSRIACNDFLASLPDNEKKPIILGAFLRSLPRAYYLHEPSLHFGLGKGHYSHFTSPIRRYSDLKVHQQLWEAEVNGKLQSKKALEKLAVDLSGKEENNDNAWYAANDRMKLRYLNEILMSGQMDFHEGVIAKVANSGLMVDIRDLGIYGFVPVDTLPGSFRKSGDALVAKRGNRSYKPGDYIYLQLSNIDFIRGTAIFHPVR